MRNTLHSGLLFILPFTAQSDGAGNVNFSGKLSSVTCNASINGGGNNATVILPTVQASSLAVTGNNAGQTGLTVAISGCNASGNLRTYFENGATADSASGPLKNTTASGAATAVQLELLDYTPVNIGNNNQNNAGFIPIGGATVILRYAVRYYATGAADAVTSSVIYSVIYK
ncbi:fimbrial protein [Citrobacter braakii]|uniref:fimbrial protein n=1 Tax=Citrobacter braakii TaxID=57706 RepID=UPI00351D768F